MQIHCRVSGLLARLYAIQKVPLLTRWKRPVLGGLRCIAGPENLLVAGIDTIVPCLTAYPAFVTGKFKEAAFRIPSAPGLAPIGET